MSAVAVFLHLLGAAIWVGGLIFVGLAAGVARRTIPDSARPEFFRSLGTGFLVLAGVAACLLFISGNVLVEDLFGGWDALGDSAAGDLVLWKTILFAAVVAIALFHALVLGPRVRRLRQAEATEAPTEAQAASLRRLSIASIATQVAMLAATLVILGLAADLTT